MANINLRGQDARTRKSLFENEAASVGAIKTYSNIYDASINEIIQMHSCSGETQGAYAPTSQCDLVLGSCYLQLRGTNSVCAFLYVMPYAKARSAVMCDSTYTVSYACKLHHHAIISVVHHHERNKK